MRKFAILENNIVIDIKMLDDDQVIEASRNATVIDINDTIPEVTVGFVLRGNKLVPSNTVDKPEVLDLYQQTAQRLFGLSILPDLVDQVGARNLKLARDQVPVDVISLATQMSSIKLLLEGGALKTVRGICFMLIHAFPRHADILENAINKITEFLILNKWN